MSSWEAADELPERAEKAQRDGIVRATPEQAARLDAFVTLSVMTKQDYICARLACEEATVMPSVKGHHISEMACRGL